MYVTSFFRILPLLIESKSLTVVVTMPTDSVAFKSKEEHRKQIELEEPRKEVDDNGKPISPHIPSYMSVAPWYLNSKEPSLKHQQNWKVDPVEREHIWYDRGAKISGITHDAQASMDQWNGYDPITYLQTHFLQIS